MRLKAWLLAHWLRLTGTPPRAGPAQTPNRVLALQQLYKFQPILYQRYSPVRGQSRVLEVPWSHVDQYTQALALAAQAVREERAIAPDWYPREMFRVSLDRFLTSSDGYYLDAQDSLTRFKTMAVQLCEAMESSDEITYGLPEHNLRMLSRMLVNLQQLTAQLIEVAAEE